MRFGIIGSAPNRQAVISWVNVPHSSRPPANYTFQAILDEETHRVRFQYKSVTPGRGPGDQGKSATVGLENAAGTVAARYSYNGSTLLVDNTAILFIPPAGAPAAGLLGVSPLEDFTSSRLAGGPFSPSSLTCTLVNTGGATLDWTAAKTQDWVSLSAVGGTLAAGASTTLTVSLNDYAHTLASGACRNTVTFHNTTPGAESPTMNVDLIIHELALSLARSEPPSAGFQLLLRGEPLQTYVFEVSPDLADWTAIATKSTGSDGILTYQDPDSGHRPMRYYRARRQP